MNTPRVDSSSHSGRPRIVLWLFLAIVATVVARGLADRLHVPEPRAAVEELLDGDADAEERLALLRRIAFGGRAESADDPQLAVQVAAASALLEDREAWQSALGAARGLPYLPDGREGADPEAFGRLALGEPAVEFLFRAYASANERRPEAAARWFERARNAAWLADLHLVQELAERR